MKLTTNNEDHDRRAAKSANEKQELPSKSSCIRNSLGIISPPKYTNGARHPFLLSGLFHGQLIIQLVRAKLSPSESIVFALLGKSGNRVLVSTGPGEVKK